MMMQAFKYIALIVGCMVVGVQMSEPKPWISMADYKNIANPGKCTVNEKTVIGVGDKVKAPRECAEITCLSKDGLGVLLGCGIVATPPDCYWTNHIDMYAPYPQCCVRNLVCDNYKNEEAKLFEEHVRNKFINSPQTRTL